MSDDARLPPSHPLHGKRIAIVGGGPAGLTLARLLQTRGVAVTVYERDASPKARGQGGSLDLHEDSGQLALRACGLEEGFRAVSRPEGQRTRVIDKLGVVRADVSAEDEAESSPEIDRGQLRDLLLGSLQPGTVVWGSRLREAVRIECGLRLAFEAENVEADLVLGCDGGWSKVRPLVSDVTLPTYSGATFVQTRVMDADDRRPRLADLVGSGNVLALGDGKGLLAQRNGDGSIRVYAALRVPEDWAVASGIDFSDAETARKAILRLFEGWAPGLLEMIGGSDDEFVPWPLYHYPARQAWEPRSDATLLGDAAHIMPPFTGRGANLAMLDALELADALTGGEFDGIGDAIAAYETAMLERTENAVEETLASMALALGEDAPTGLAAMMNGKP